jgi:hypothetical protein
MKKRTAFFVQLEIFAREGRIMHNEVATAMSGPASLSPLIWRLPNGPRSLVMNK